MMEQDGDIQSMHPSPNIFHCQKQLYTAFFMRAWVACMLKKRDVALLANYMQRIELPASNIQIHSSLLYFSMQLLRTLILLYYGMN